MKTLNTKNSDHSDTLFTNDYKLDKHFDDQDLHMLVYIETKSIRHMLVYIETNLSSLKQFNNR